MRAPTSNPNAPAMAALLVARAMGSALVNGRFAASLARRERLRVETDGDAARPPRSEELHAFQGHQADRAAHAA